ncbi:hypothetical protein [Roseovarius sp. D22-M7]|uniref:hypothetical protein n=1 Tax=Roseovarius sp. D22-M7 TaxID=3127116 RepID=UPI0030104E5E
MSDTGQAHHYNAREPARKLGAYPTPLLANADLQNRWHCSRSTVDRIRKVYGLRNDVPECGHPLFDLLNVLKIENISIPLLAWALGTDDDREVLAAELLSIDDLKLLDRTIGGHHPETFRRRARSGNTSARKV